MCNIAGYVGKREAAPIILEMLRREEGFAGGYYSGLATMQGGKIFSEKLTGDVERLLSETPALACRGNIGIAHSRSKFGILFPQYTGMTLKKYIALNTYVK